MKKFIQFAVFIFLLCFISSPYTEARTVITNDVDLDFVQESHIFHFADRDIRCVGTFSPNASLDCNKHVPTSYIRTSTYTLTLPTFEQKYLSSQPTIIYMSFIVEMDHPESYTTVITSAIEAQIINTQVCYSATQRKGRTTSPGIYTRSQEVRLRGLITSIQVSCVPLGVEIPPGFEEFTR